jgi:hypothetical protein
VFKKALRPTMIVANDESEHRAVNQRDPDQHGRADGKDLQQRGVLLDGKSGHPRT